MLLVFFVKIYDSQFVQLRHFGSDHVSRSVCANFDFGWTMAWLFQNGLTLAIHSDAHLKCSGFRVKLKVFISSAANKTYFSIWAYLPIRASQLAIEN